MLPRFASGFSVALALGACAATIPQAELDRCRSGMADGNDSFQVRQGAACRMIAQRLVAEEEHAEAVAYARKACALEDARGCDQYLALVRGQIGLPIDELSVARAVGEKACAGMVVGVDQTDARPAICNRTAELYADLEPRSPADAGRLYARACKLGDEKSCVRARSLGADPTPAVPPAKPPRSQRCQPRFPRFRSRGPRQARPLSRRPPPATRCAPVCLSMPNKETRTRWSGLANHCDRSVVCAWCPSRGDQVDKTACRKTSLAPNESKAGRESGLWYEGYNAIAYDCIDANDDRGCLAM